MENKFSTFQLVKLRAETIAKIRSFFSDRKVLEVETPLLAPTTITASYLHSFVLKTFSTQKLGVALNQEQELFLQTSPEFYMKRLLAQGSKDIYQICKAFREKESGRHHNPEFTILEWYRLDFDHHKLMTEMNDLLQFVLNCPKAEKISYRELFQKYLNLDPWQTTITDLKNVAKKHQLTHIESGEEDLDWWLSYLMSGLIEPQIGKEAPIFIYDYPASQAALSRLKEDDPAVGNRFEVYFKGLELANGFFELNNSEEQRKRFEHDLAERKKFRLPPIPIDEKFLQSLPNLPLCSGVALGIDRLIMILAKASSLKEVIFFPEEY
jgi:elongation factor P--(R)-beta-lysine ligase